MAPPKLPKCVWWQYSEKNLLPARVGLQQFAANPDTCVPLKNMFLLAGFREPGKRLQELISKDKGIPNALGRVSEIVTAHMRKVWPDWKRQRVSLTQNGDSIDAGIADEFNTYSLARRSDGFKRFFMFLLQISMQNATEDISNVVIVIDEPDIGLHPAGIQYLREELKSISRQNLVLASSHSIFMVDREVVDRHYIVEKAREITTISQVDSSKFTDEEVIFRALSYSLFELLKPRNIIFEGWRDKRLFRQVLNSNRGKAIKGKRKTDDLGLLHAIAASDISRVANVCENFARQYVILSDADKASKDQKKHFHDQSRWFPYDVVPGIGALTTEDFIANSRIRKAVSSVLVNHTPPIQVTIPDDLRQGKLDYIRGELTRQAVTGDSLRSLMDRIKGEISDTVTTAEVDKSFDTVCKHVLEQLYA